MAYTTAAMAIVAAVTTAVSAVQQGQAQAAQSKYQATVMQQQADRERQIAAADEESFRRRQSRLMAERRAGMGATGVEGGTGSPLLVSEDFASENELQALMIRSGGETRATRLEQSAGLARMQGRNAKQSGYMRAGSSLLSGFGQAAGGFSYGGGVSDTAPSSSASWRMESNPHGWGM